MGVREASFASIGPAVALEFELPAARKVGGNFQGKFCMGGNIGGHYGHMIVRVALGIIYEADHDGAVVE